MNKIIQTLRPQSVVGSFFSSIFVHVLIIGTVLIILNHRALVVPQAEDYLDLGYQTFDEPPPPVEEVKRVVRAQEPDTPVDPVAKPDSAPHEMQDEKGDVAGTQDAAPQPSHVGADTNGETASTPYYKIKPKYPKAALQSGAEGWVLMNIDINESGEVENIRVVDGEQRNMFQDEARRAVSKWKYKPFVDNTGKPFKKSDHQVRVDFKLQDVSANQ